MPNTARKNQLTNPSNTAFDPAKNQWDSEEAVRYYSQKNRGTRRDRREKACVSRAIETVPRGAHVLDLPCGTGRMTHFLYKRGYSVTAADCSEHMVSEAKREFDRVVGAQSNTLQRIAFGQEDISNLTYKDNSFDAVVCNRLFHHYKSSELRQQALHELGRVSKGPIVVSFFSSFNISTVRVRLKHYMRGNTNPGRVPIPYATFESDVNATGLRIDGVFYVKKFVSSQTYVRLVKKT